MSSFDKIIGYEGIKTELLRYCDVLKNPQIYHELGVKIPKGILLEGNPGLGKTMIAKCFIEESGCKSYILRKDKPDGDFVNEIRNVFERAKSDQCAIVLLDDMDKYANEDESHRDAEEYVTIQSCIDECKDSGVFVIATVNCIFSLPESLMRAGRFDKIIEMQFPKGEDAKRIVEYYLSQKQVVKNIDIEEISRLMEGHSCATLEAVINEAGIYAGFERRNKIEHADLLKACMRLIFDAPEVNDIKDNDILKRIAVHEAGHVVVAEVLNPGSVSLTSVQEFYGSKQGTTSNNKADDYNFNKSAQENEVVILLGGKAATEMVLGLNDVGCSNDISLASILVSAFVDDYCSFGFDSFEGPNPSQFLLENKDRLVAYEMNKYYQRAKQIIAENREFLDAITKELIEKKMLTYKDIKRMRLNTVGSC